LPVNCKLAYHELSGLGVDPALHVNIFQKFDLVRSSAGVSQVQGFHNESKAYLFEGACNWHLTSQSKRILQKLRGRTEFTLLLTLKQEKFSSGVLLSIHYGEQRIYERIVETPSMDFPRGTNIWLGQRNDAHGFFRGVMQDVQLVVIPHGYVVQCPDLNRTCPTCNDFHGLVQKIMELQDILAKTSSKLALAEEKMKYLDGCYCERTCTLNGEIYRDDDAWIDGCRNCTCSNGTVECESIFCPPPQCPPDTAPIYMPGACCKECQRECTHKHTHTHTHTHTNEAVRLQRCIYLVEITSCPELNCPESEQITLTDRCCKVCRGHDFCAEGHSRNCVENSDCINLEAGAFCSCKEGYHALRDDSAYCQDIDECAEGKHYCRENTMCMNTPGSFMCVCNTGYVRIDDYSCTEHDECVHGLNTCDENALCFNMVGGHSCSCKPGYVGNGTVCRVCVCVCESVCVCFSHACLHLVSSDIDECSDGFVECDSRATCVNLPGWYHCECRDGYHDNGIFSANGESCEDIDECEMGRHSCANDTVCFNVDGGYDCRCPHGRNCTGDCAHDGKVKHNGQIWVLDDDRCSVCSCQSGLVMCRRMVCDCENPTVDVLCCPECDPRLSSQCLHQNGLLAYSNGETWVENCQQCQCMRGEVDCWPISCAPVADCEFTVVPEGECCPRCITDPCLADTVRNDISKTCVDEYGITRFSGSAWTKHGTECSLCQCKVLDTYIITHRRTRCKSPRFIIAIK
uniref:NEL-like protein 2 n=1 Tax=Sinocyclocheilus anshuiensis TaxID=1608454 RepID=A0A671QNJ9_9TELE